MGPNPSDADRDIVLPVIVSPGGGGLRGGRIHRRTRAMQKADAQYAVGRRPDGSAIRYDPATTHASAFAGGVVALDPDRPARRRFGLGALSRDEFAGRRVSVWA